VSQDQEEWHHDEVPNTNVFHLNMEFELGTMASNLMKVVADRLFSPK